MIQLDTGLVTLVCWVVSELLRTKLVVLLSMRHGDLFSSFKCIQLCFCVNTSLLPSTMVDIVVQMSSTNVIFMFILLVISDSEHIIRSLK